MKAQILKIAGVKSEAAFYKKFPSQEAFMKVHGKEFKKAQTANAIEKAQYGPMNQGIPSTNYYNATSTPGLPGYGQTDGSIVLNDQQLNNNKGQLNGYAFGGGPGSGGDQDFMAKASPYFGAGMDVIQGLSMLGGDEKNKAEQTSLVTDKIADAYESVDVDAARQREDYATRKRNAFMTPIVGESLFPVTGVGTNPLAQHGGEIQNTYDPYDIYDDGGYEPLDEDEDYNEYVEDDEEEYADEDKIKTYQMGGQSAGDIAGQFVPFAKNLSNTYINQGGQPDAGSMIGGGIGKAAGTAFGGPLGGAIGEVAGSAIGGLIDTTDRDIKKFENESQRNIGRITGQSFIKDTNSKFKAYKQDGGYVPLAKNGKKIQYDPKHSIVDLLATQGKDYDYDSRKVLAKKLGIKNYRGTADQNISMIHMLDGVDDKPKTNTPNKKGVVSQIKKTTTPDKKQTPNPNDISFRRKIGEVDNPFKQMPVRQPSTPVSKKETTPVKKAAPVKAEPSKQAPVKKQAPTPVQKPVSGKRPINDISYGSNFGQVDNPFKVTQPSKPKPAAPVQSKPVTKPKDKSVIRITPPSKPKQKANPNEDFSMFSGNRDKRLIDEISSGKNMFNQDPRRLQSGVITDKGTNMSHVIENGKIVKSFPVLTGKARDWNQNDYPMEYLDKHTEKQATPTGTYFMKPNPNIYNEPGFDLQPIEAFGQAAPKAKSTAVHVTYPLEFAKRNPLYDKPADKRNVSMGCTNCKKPDVNDLTQRYPVGDTAVYIDSRKKQDANFIKKFSKQDGGYVSNDWTPQVIAKFGDHSAEDYYDYAHEYDTLRAGGHVKSEEYTPVSNRGMETYENGGEVKTSALNGAVQTLWGGGVKTLAQNPAMPGTGKIIQFVGNSHSTSDGNGNKGIGVKYGQGGESEQGEQANVVVEKEPAFETIDPNTGKPTLIVWGDRKVHASFAKQLGDPDLIKIAKNHDGQKFKNIGVEYAKQTKKWKDFLDKNIKELAEFDPKDQIQKTTVAALKANIDAGNLHLQKIADNTMTLTHFQNAINDTADELGESLGKDISSSNLNKGKVMFGKDKGQIAKYGAAIERAQVGTYKVKGNLPGSIDYNTPDEAGDQYKGTNYETVWTPKVQKAFNDPATASKLIADLENYSGEDAADVKAQLAKEPNLYRKIARAYELATDHKVGPYHTLLNGLIDKNTATPTTTPTTTAKPEEDKVYDVEAQKRNPWIDLGNQALKYFRPSDAEGLDPQQLYGELYGLSNNQVDPVQAQFYHPELDVPYDISLQDQINEVTAGSRAAQRMVGYNPAAQAAIAAQAYEPINRIKGEQFRLNQAKKDQVYAGNRATLNDAQFKNLGIADTQYNRQETAKSNTKAINQAALNSISSKYAQNKLDNRTLQTYENMYNYRFGKDFVADNYNGVAQFNMPNVYDKGDEKANMVPIYNDDDEVTGFKKIAKNGVALKKSNGSIVSLYKRL